MNREEPIPEENNEKRQPKSEIDQLCQLVDQTAVVDRIQGSSLKSSCLSSRFRSVPSSQVKAFRLKRLHSSKLVVDDETASRRSWAMRFSLSSSSPSFVHRFRSLSTSPSPSPTRRQSSPSSSSSLTLFRTTSMLPPIVEEQSTDDLLTPPLSCTIVDARRPAGNSCNVEELAAYLDNFLYLPKSLSGAAELMYT